MISTNYSTTSCTSPIKSVLHAMNVCAFSGSSYNIATFLGSSSSSSSCFQGDETVETETDGVKPISDVSVGERVLTADSQVAT